MRKDRKEGGGGKGGRDVPEGIGVGGVRGSLSEEGQEALQESKLGAEWDDGKGRYVEEEGGLEGGREGGRARGREGETEGGKEKTGR